jgi:hypothetical protein
LAVPLTGLARAGSPAEAEARDKILTALDDSPALLPALLAKQAGSSAGPAGEDPGARLRSIDERRDELACRQLTMGEAL